MKKSIFRKTIALIMVLAMSLTCSTFSAFAEDNAVMTVAVEGGDTLNFNSFNDGWVYALQQSLSKPTTITLLADWVAPDGNFYCEDENGDEYGTNNGYLYINDDHIITIDLNGHTIDRNLDEATDDGMVFYLYDYDSKLTIKDFAGGGKITGANNTGDGGAFYMDRGSLFIEGGEITGNKALNGAGIFAASKNNLCIIGGKITGNTANENGGGIYGDDWGPFYFGGDVVIIGNTGNGTANNLYLEDDDVVIRRAAGQQDEVIPKVPFKDGASIGISTYRKENTRITGTESYFNWLDYRYFSSDDSAYDIRPAFNDSRVNWTDEYDFTHQRMMYITPVGDIVYPKITEVSLAGNASHHICNLEFDQENQIITATAYYEDMRTLNDNYTWFVDAFYYATDTEGTDSYTIDNLYWADNNDPITMALVSEKVDGTYNTFDIVTKWICRECTDNTGDAKCDDCGKDVNLVAIGDVAYPTLQDAVTNAKKGDTIKFLANNVLVTPVTIPEGKEITIDFNGKRLTSIESVLAHGAYLIENYGNLTITDSGDNGSWYSLEYYGIKTYGPLTINGIDSRIVQGQCNLVYAINAPVTFNDGYFNCAGYGASINAEGNSIITINGGWFQNDYGGCTMEASGNPKFYINGGAFRGNNSKSGAIDCVITGGTFVPSEAYFAEEYAASDCVVSPNADASLYAVIKPSNYFTYLGAGLKYAGASAYEAKIRFGYDFKDDFDLTASNWRWNYGINKDRLISVAGENYNEKNITNLVVSKINPIMFDQMMYSQLVFDVTIDGDTYTVEDAIRGTNVKYLAESILANSKESQAVKNYAEQLLAAQ